MRFEEHLDHVGAVAARIASFHTDVADPLRVAAAHAVPRCRHGRAERHDHHDPKRARHRHHLHTVATETP
jgi:hypothetical protein